MSSTTRDLETIARIVVNGYYRVYHTLGHGFLEKVYENALALELEERGLQVAKQAPIKVYYLGQPVGEYYADLLVDGRLIVEIKAVDGLAVEHTAQLLNYLKATGLRLGLLVNFGPKPEIKRRIYQTPQKQPDVRPHQKGS